MPDTATVAITRGLFAIVDLSDLDLVSEYRWFASPSAQTDERYYAATCVGIGTKRTTIYMHRLILSAKRGQMVDHADGDGLNNTRANLRFATPSQNGANRRAQDGNNPYRGVYLDRHGKLWRPSITVHGRTVRLGVFSTAEEAARAYDVAALANFGAFARLNFPEALRSAG